MTAPARQIIDAADWASARFGWLESVRRDVAISAAARLVAHILALDFANHRTMQCNPSLTDIAGLLGKSEDTAKRAVFELIEAGWISREAGRGRGKTSGYVFLTRAKIVVLKGRSPAPFYDAEKGASVRGFTGSQKGANLPGKGGKSAPPYNIAKPYKNHRAGDAAVPGRIAPSKNPLVVREAEGAVQRFREGRADAFDGLPVWTKNHIIAANLLTDAERQAACIG